MQPASESVSGTKGLAMARLGGAHAAGGSEAVLGLSGDAHCVPRPAVLPGCQRKWTECTSRWLSPASVDRRSRRMPPVRWIAFDVVGHELGATLHGARGASMSSAWRSDG